MTKPNIIACIIVRMKSTRLPRKALASVAGKPMTQRIIERLRQSKRIDNIILCTSTHPDDHILIQKAKEWGVEAIAGSEDDVLSRLVDVVDQYQATHVIRVTGDNIFTDPEYIDRMIVTHLEKGADYSRTNGLPLGVTAEIMSAEMLPALNDALPDSSHSEYMMLYAYNPEHFCINALDAAQDVNRPNFSLTVDTPADLSLANTLYAELPNFAGGPKLADIVAYLDANPVATKNISNSTLLKLPDDKQITFGDFLEMMNERAAIARQKQT